MSVNTRMTSVTHHTTPHSLHQGAGRRGGGGLESVLPPAHDGHGCASQKRVPLLSLACTVETRCKVCIGVPSALAATLLCSAPRSSHVTFLNLGILKEAFRWCLRWIKGKNIVVYEVPLQI